MTRTVETINVHELKQKMDNQADLCLIDVRELEEWQALHIPGATLIPKNEIISAIGSKVTDKMQNIYLHCRSGVRSLYAAQTLLDAGYVNVYSIDGGIMEWAMYGYPVAAQ